MSKYRCHICGNWEYGCETGNWYGKCKKCGIPLISYVGNSWQRPNVRVPQIVRVFGFPSSWEEDQKKGHFRVLKFDTEVTQPSLVIEYPLCKGDKK